MEIVAFAVLPALLELSAHRLGLTPRHARLWWLLVLPGVAAAVLPTGAASIVAAVVFLVPSLGLTMGSLARILAARARPVDEDRGSWLLGQAAVGIGLAGPAVLGWALVARSMGVDFPDLPVVRGLVGVTAAGLVGGEMALASAGTWGRAAALLALGTAVLALVPGPWWLVTLAATTACVGLTMRREVRRALPGAPGTDGLVPLLGAVMTLGLVPLFPAVAALVAGAALTAAAWFWHRLVTRLHASSDHGAGCTCCAHETVA